MPRLVTYINSTLTSELLGTTHLVRNVSAKIQFEDYMNLYGFVAYLQNLTEVSKTSLLTKPSSFGVKSLIQPNNSGNNTMITIEISY